MYRHKAYIVTNYSAVSSSNKQNYKEFYQKWMRYLLDNVAAGRP